MPFIGESWKVNLEIMKELLKSVCVAMFAAVVPGISFAQSSQMATLVHEGAITNFYSATAFKEALDAAVDGDVISLSSGVFQSADILKNISIRGAGAVISGYNDNEIPTVLSGDFKIETASDANHRLNIEGITHNGNIAVRAADGLTVSKCVFKQFTPVHDNGLKSQWKDFKFLHCVFDEFLPSKNYLASMSVSFVNCVIKKNMEFDYSANDLTSDFLNSVVYTYTTLANTNMINSVAYMQEKGGAVKKALSTANFNNCIIAHCEIWESSGQNNKFHNDLVFVKDTFYQLKEELKSFIGTDGKEVGIHGGNQPFTPVTSRPRITRFDVGSKTTADGKLSVDIEISGEE